ncbi:MAG: DUF5658 family protein [Vicinamibacterales bacterium]
MRRQEVLVLAIFLAAQLLDGTLTYIGVHRFGIEAEGNVLLTTLMQAWGTGPALVAAKLFSSACGVILFVVSVYRLLAAVAGACIGFAVIPWVFMLGW